MKTHVFLIDNFDSFTYNLVDELRAIGFELSVYRNSMNADALLEKMDDAAKSRPVMLMLSPGPGEPTSAGCMMALLDKVKGRYPVLGICLGHQAIVQSYGGDIVRANVVMHGKSSPMKCETHPIFDGLPNPLPIARYHSLMAANLPSSLQALAMTSDLTGDVTMAVLHPDDAMLGFQFHPESILTQQGSQLLKQSVEYLVSLTATSQGDAAHG
ncbi:aminodeoxychorismate/anthranilate synthase component II [Aestuariibacter sp. AA17]|uniref:anthranilate synthase n=1 Tax=Fluctibacter corallii TaxID=2984329 RepID=A0ABT3A673_9ALTE|nr:aminodeoxychorismate/anthranilate synthase component II [Aestuariibacter sp. AA17]MCV2883861.1 aminodeoxychorismate/anthranilate synthase component II [Aestuariibacter sp. AA17]